MPLRVPTFPAPPALREPLPDPVELLRMSVDGLWQPLTTLERWLDRMEAAR